VAVAPAPVRHDVLPAQDEHARPHTAKTPSLPTSPGLHSVMTKSEVLNSLRWFYGGEAEQALGLKGVALEPGFGRVHDTSDGAEVASRRADDCIKYSDIRTKLQALTASQERTLRVAFTPSSLWPFELVRLFEVGPVAALIIAEGGGGAPVQDQLATLASVYPGHSPLYLAARVVVSVSLSTQAGELLGLAKARLRDALSAFIRGRSDTGIATPIAASSKKAFS